MYNESHSNPFLPAGDDGNDGSNPFHDPPPANNNPFHDNMDMGAHFVDPDHDVFDYSDLHHNSQHIPLHEEVVPAVHIHSVMPLSTAPSGGASSTWGASSNQGGAWTDGQVPAVPMGWAPSDLAFTESTVIPIGVSGKIGSDARGKGGGSGRDNGGGPSRDNTGTEALLPEDPSKHPFWNLRRYRPYFDVNTEEVMWRVGNSLLGALRPNFMEITQEAPDLYGPFWVATTLVFVTAVSGNFSSYLAWAQQSHQSHAPSPSSASDFAPPSGSGSTTTTTSGNNDQWFADSTKMSASAGLFYGYVFIIGLILYFVVKYFRGDLKLVNIYCIYGYSLSIFIPVSLLCIIPINWLRWLLVMAATVMSGGFLTMNFRKAIEESATSQSLPVLGALAATHVGLGLALKLYFFNY